MDLTGKTALVTGASSGIGREFARQLADSGARLVLTARRVDRLEALAHELRREKRVQVDVVPLDLGAPAGPADLFARTEGAGIRVDVLINNAGAGALGEFLETPWEASLQQLQLNVISATELAHRFGTAMKARKQGWILNVASVAAYGALPGYATYAAGKSYVLSFSQALSNELRGSGVVVSCLSPGITQTEFHKVAKHTLPKSARLITMTATDTAEAGLTGLFEGRANIVPGVLNKLTAALMSLLPGPAVTELGATTTARPREP